MSKLYACSLAIKNSWGRKSKAFDRSVSNATNAPPCQHFSSICQLEFPSSVVRCSLYETRIDIWIIKNRKRTEFDHKYIFHKFWKYWIIRLLTYSYLWSFSTSFYWLGFHQLFRYTGCYFRKNILQNRLNFV